MERNHLRLGVILMFLLSAVFQLHSEARLLTLDDAIRTAIENNQQTKMASLDIDKANALVGEAYGYVMPNVNVSANFMHYLKQPVFFLPAAFFNAMNPDSTTHLADDAVVPMKIGGTNSYETKAEVSQILFNSTVFNGIGSSKIYLDLSKEQLRGSVSKVVTNVKKAFFGVILTKNLLEISKASLANAEENLKNVKALLDNGLVSEYDYLQADVQVENFRPSVIQLENALKDAENGLKMAMGTDPNEEISVSGELSYSDEDIPDENSTLERAVSKNFDLRTINLKKQVDHAMIDLYDSEYWPSLVAFGNYSYTGQSEKLNFESVGVSVVGLNFSMNLFNGFQTSSRVQQATVEFYKSVEQESQFRDYLKTQVKSKLRNLEAVKAKIQSQDANIKRAEKAYQISTVRYKEGTGNQLEIQNSDIALRLAKTNRLQSVYEYISNKIDLEELVGGLDAKWLLPFENKISN